VKYCRQCSTNYPADLTVCPKDDSLLADVFELEPGMVIRHKYEIVRKIGSGGMATVHEARHIAFNETVAIKVVKAGFGRDEEFLSRFRTEARVARKLQHPNAVTIIDLDETEDGMPFIVMELVSGADLRAIIQEQGAMPVARVLRVARQVASALSTAHKLGIIHRDIKPDNIFLTGARDSEQAKVLDFGIARHQDASIDEKHQTKTGMMVGTPEYASPEQATGIRGGQLDGRCDQYSLGVTLYEMLTGISPFKADSGMEMLIKHCHEKVQGPDLMRPELNIPSSVSAVVMRCLEKKREDRYPNAEALIEAIDACTADMAAGQRSAATVIRKVPTPPRPTPVTRPKVPSMRTPAVTVQRPVTRSVPVEKSSSKSWIIAAVLALAIGAGGYWAYLQNEKRTQISEAVEAKLKDLPGVNAAVNFDLSVDLTGTVHSYPESANAVVAIQSVPLVSDVHNRLAIDFTKPPAPAEPSQPDTSQADKSPKPSGDTASTTDNAEAKPEDTTRTSQTRSATLNNLISRIPARSSNTTPPNASQDQVKNLITQGTHERENGDYEAAIKTLERALQIEPSNSVAKSELSRAREAKQAEENILQRRR